MTLTSAHIIDHMGLGGVQTFLRAVLPGLRGYGYAPTVISLRRPTELSRALEASGVPVLSLDLPRWSPAQFTALASALHRMRPAVAHTYLTVGNLVGRAAAIAARIPAIVMEDQLSVSQDVYSVPPPVVLAYRLAERRLSRSTTLYLGPSRIVQEASSAAKGWPPDRCRVLPNAVDCRRFAPPPGGEADARRARARLRAELGLTNGPTVATFGRFVAQKRIGDVVDIARRVAADLPDAQFLIAGGGPLEGAIRRRIAEAGLEGRVRMLGRRQDTERILAACDVYLSVSAGEVLSVAILEAMAAGCPVVATDAGGTREQVRDGVNGFVRPVGDLDGLAAATLGLLRDPAAAARLGRRGRQIALEQFDVPVAVARLAAIYDEALTHNAVLPTS